MQKIYRWLAPLLAALFLLPSSLHAQKVGLVLSGGGAKGLAHVGVLKQLEKNRVPIDYIVGTSMGAIVGALYAAGYSPKEIEEIVLKPEFQNWVSGAPLEGKVYNYYDVDPTPAALHLRLAVDSTLKTRVTPKLVDDVTLNYVLATMLAPAGAISGYDFNNLLVPYRAVASEVFTREKVVQRSGSLSDAVRNSMAFPLAFRPIRQADGRYLFDGAVVDNFPTGVMREEFKPDIIIGVNVGDVAFNKYPKEKDDQLLTSTLVFLGSNVADTTSVGKNGIFIQPNLDGITAADFNKVRQLLQLGEQAADKKMELLLKRIPRREDTLALQQRRRAFQEKAPRPDFKQITVQGLPRQQQDFVRRFFVRNGTSYSPGDIEEGYYRLVNNDFFNNVYPRIRYDQKQEGYVLGIDARQNSNLTADLGVMLSTRSMNNFYIGGAYRYLNRYLYTVRADATIGRFYNGARGSFRISIPGRIPLYFEPTVTFNNFNYQDTGGLLGSTAQNTQLSQRDFKTELQIGFSPNYRSRYTLSGGLFTNRDQYANTDEISSNATLDLDRLQGVTAAGRFERNSLNRRQYAVSGRRADFSVRAVSAQEKYTPGTTAGDLTERSRTHNFLKASLFIEQYFTFNKVDSVGRKVNAWGYIFDAVATTQGPFATYRASLTSAPAFLPLPDSRTLFLDRYRGTAYAAVGLRYTKAVLGPVEWRTEIYGHVLVRQWERQEGNTLLAERGNTISRPYLTAMTGFVYQTPVGPASLQFIHYDDADNKFGVFAHIGYVLFRDRSLD
ncbi:patatin-like phospholipase family protein [Hymenobacter cellulosivorans]|uniref:Patatin-like phospholipase family protein n=1 Tax=Hymenobacter cellulosivorans TaxID=2932249 RepID=A0ABY4FB21_9BACT|nr:patatin-like phospholipase family protein [Hymenobacter cellulosivorans]UOQ53873.1 patatin-like phospholipase family protein [Hymenobacter cellulosivorans]